MQMSADRPSITLSCSGVERMERVQKRRAETAMALARLKARARNLCVHVMGDEPQLIGKARK